MKIRSLAPALLMALLVCAAIVTGCNSSGAGGDPTPPATKAQPLPPGSNLANPSKPAAGYTGPETGRAAETGAANQGK